MIVYTLGWLEGAQRGVEFLFIPDWDMVLDPNIWAKAASQILFSLSVGFGGAETLIKGLWPPCCDMHLMVDYVILLSPIYPQW